MIRVIPFEPEHMKNIARHSEPTSVISLFDDIDARAAAYAANGPAVTLIDEDAILAAGGVICFWQGAGEAWLMISPEGRRRPCLLYKHFRTFLENCFLDGGFHRIQGACLYGHRAAHRLAMSLGFIPEGMMVHYGPKKENYVRYARFR